MKLTTKLLDFMQLKATFSNYYLFCKKNRIAGFLLFIGKRIHEIRLNQVAASLSYTTLMALVPFITIALIVVSAFPVFDDISTRFKMFLATTLLPEHTARFIGGYMKEFTQKAGNLTALGIVILGFSSFLLMMTIEKTFNQIWRIKRTRPVLLRLLVYWTVLTLGPIIIGAGMSVWNWLFNDTLFPQIYPVFAKLVRISGSIGMSTLLLYLLYRIVPYCYVPNQHALTGAFLASIGLEITRRGFSLYVAKLANYQLIYGAFAALPILLIWVFCLWYVLLMGAVISASLSYWKGEAFRRASDTRGQFNEVLEIMILLLNAQKKGEAVQIKEFRRFVQIGYDELVALLEKLAHRNYIQKSQDGWILKMNPEQICLAELFKQFIYKPYKTGHNDRLIETIQDILSPSLNSLNLSLTDFANRLDQKSSKFDLPSIQRS